MRAAPAAAASPACEPIRLRHDPLRRTPSLSGGGCALAGGDDALAFFGDHEILPEPKSSISGVKTDGLGGYQTEEYAMPSEGKDPGFVSAK